MIGKGFFFLVLIGYSVNCMSQNDTGFYYESTNKHCKYWADSFDNKKHYCITKEPVIGLRDFESMGDMQYDAVKQTKRIQIKLSDPALKRLKLMTNKFPNRKLLLVVKKRIVGSFDLNGLLIDGDVESGEIDWLFENFQLKK